MSYKYVQVEL